MTIIAVLVDPSATPFALRPLGTAFSSSVGGDSLTIVAGPRTDWFVDPGLGRARLDAPGFVGATSGDFLFSARVEVEFAATFDAGVLAVWRDEQTWAKLCFEYSPDREAMVVSVVTRATSDACNSTVVDGSAVGSGSRASGASSRFMPRPTERSVGSCAIRADRRRGDRGGIRGAVAARRGLHSDVL